MDALFTKPSKIFSTSGKPFVLGLMLLLASCGSEAPPEAATEDPGTPPSISGKSAAELGRLSEQQAQDLDIQVYTIKEQQLPFTITAPGQVFGAPEGLSSVGAPINGRVAQIYAHEGERVQKGDPLLVLESLEFANLVAAHLEATAEITYQQQQVERLKVLSEEKITPQSRLERAQADLMLAQARENAAHSRLQAVGLSDDMIENLDPESDAGHARLTIYSPITGTINQHLIDLGQSVQAYDKMMDIIDNTRVLVRGYVSPADAPFLKPGNTAIIAEREDDGGGQRQIKAEITTINPALDPTNKSIVLNTIVETEGGWPIVGQNVRMTYSADPVETTTSIPLSAIQFEGTQATVFVQHSPREYEKRTVDIQRMTPENALLRSGVEAGEKIAVTQVFSLKALERYEQFAE